MADHEQFAKHHHLVIGKTEWPIKASVVQWADSGLEVHPGKSARRRGSLIDKFVIHWTGGENDVLTLFKVLAKRELSVEFAIDVEGVIWQFCDPTLVDTFDAGIVNRTSAGCEIVNHGFTAPGRPAPRSGAARDTYSRKFRGSQRTFARFYPAQINAAVALADVLSGVLPIPRRIPREVDGSIMARTMTPRELDSWSGHMGHFHISDRKCDPGLDLLEALGASGY